MEDDAIHLGTFGGREVRVPKTVGRFTFARASGPGGQHVNKTSTKAMLTVSLEELSGYLPKAALWRLPDIAVMYFVPDPATEPGAGDRELEPGDGEPKRVTGRLILTSSETRSQADNRDKCWAKLEALLRRAMRRPTPRRATRPTRSSKKKRLEDKAKRGQTKRMRRRPGQDD